MRREQKQNMMGIQYNGHERFFNSEGQAGERGVMGSSTAGTVATSQGDLDTSQHIPQCVSERETKMTYR